MNSLSPESGSKEHACVSGAEPSVDAQHSKRLTDPEPPPVENSLPAVWGLVISDMRERDQFGRSKYGTPLQPRNGRDALADAYQEALDLCVYLRQAIYERDGR